MLHPFMPDVSAQIQDQLQVCTEQLHAFKHDHHLQTSRETSVILDYFTPFMKRGHKIGEVCACITVIIAVEPISKSSV